MVSGFTIVATSSSACLPSFIPISARVLGDFRERFSTRLPTGSPASHPVWWGVTFPQRGEARWGVIPQAAVRGRGHRPRVPPSNLPPLGEGKEFVHTVVDHNKGESF
jgi:hypothetical protein